MNLDKVIKGVKQCAIQTPSACKDCPYDNPEKDARCGREMLNDNKDEGIEPVDDGQGSLICGNQGYECGVVGRRNIETEKIERYCNYCAMCGAKVKWE